MPDTLELALLRCASIPPAAGARAAFRHLKLAGGRFVSYAKFTPGANPEEAILSDGSIYSGAVYQHQSLAHDYRLRRHGDASPGAPGVAHFSYLADSATVILNQFLLDCDPEEIDRVANGLLILGRILAPLLRPEYGFVDFMGANSTDGADSRFSELQNLYWSNLFSQTMPGCPEESFFLHIPYGSVESLGDGGILYTVTERFADWGIRPHQEIVEYFQQRYLALQRYYPQPIDIW
jgi:hypothetical protein